MPSPYGTIHVCFTLTPSAADRREAALGFLAYDAPMRGFLLQ